MLIRKTIVCIQVVLLLFTMTACQQNRDIQRVSEPKNAIPIVEPEQKYASKHGSKIDSLNKTSDKKIIVIDPGHQAKQNSDLEPIGPMATEKKKKVSSGTRGVETGLYEYKLNLIVSLKLKTALESQGYQVIMTRTTNNVNISNIERAKIANNANAHVLIRIHANGNEDSNTNGVMTICNTSSNPYNASIYSQCRILSDYILSGILEATGASSKGVWETDSMTGINWSKVPATIVEMGYMTNKTEDILLSTKEYQDNIVKGICNALNQYFNAMNE